MDHRSEERWTLLPVSLAFQSLLLEAEAGMPTPCVRRAAWAVLNCSAAKSLLRDVIKDWKHKLTQPTCWNMAGYHWLEWNFTPAEAYSSHDPIFEKINMNVCLHPQCKLFKGDKARESKYKSFYRPGCQLTSCFVSSLPNICSAERKTWVFLCNVCEWVGVFILTLVCLSSANKIRSDQHPLLAAPTAAQPGTGLEQGAPCAQCVKGPVGSWGYLSSHKENRCVCVWLHRKPNVLFIKGSFLVFCGTGHPCICIFGQEK